MGLPSHVRCFAPWTLVLREVAVLLQHTQVGVWFLKDMNAEDVIRILISIGVAAMAIGMIAGSEWVQAFGGCSCILSVFVLLFVSVLSFIQRKKH